MAVSRYRVTCDAVIPRAYGALAPCAWDGYRRGPVPEVVMPCPRCGGPVQVTPLRREGE